MKTLVVWLGVYAIAVTLHTWGTGHLLHGAAIALGTATLKTTWGLAACWLTRVMNRCHCRWTKPTLTFKGMVVITAIIVTIETGSPLHGLVGSLIACTLQSVWVSIWTQPVARLAAEGAA